MYNEERKLEYIRKKEESVVLANNLINAFIKAEPREKMYDRDMCEWTSEEILDFYRYLSSNSIQSLVLLHNSLTMYTNWCINNNLVSDNQNHYMEIHSDTLCNCVNTRAVDNILFTREELLECIKGLYNFSDQFIFLGLFEGIVIGEICNIKLSDIHGNVATLSNGVKLHISNELKHLAEWADEETTYKFISEIRTRECKYVDSEYIIKPFESKRGIIEKPSLIVGRRIRKCVKVLGLPDGITIKSIQESGRIHFIKEFAKSHNIDPEEMITNPRLREIHEKIYGKIQNKMTYMIIYGNKLMEGGV